MSKYTERPIIPIDPDRSRSALQILEALGDCSFQGRNLNLALQVLETMYQDEGAGVVLTLAGAMVPAGMGEVVCRLMEKGIIQAIVSTGANISHDLVNAAKGGHGHYLGDPGADDDELYEHRINRIYDTNLPEENYLAAEKVLEAIWRPIQEAHDAAEPGRPLILPPSEVFRRTGAALSEQGRRSIMAVAHETGTPIYCGATSDSEFCLNFARFRYRGWCNMILDEIDDLFRMGDWIRAYERRGALIVGGGVPRNWAQQIFPLLDMIDDQHFPGYDYGVRISTDNVVFGGLSGCTISESKSWGKYGSHARFAEVACDATIALPVLTAALFDRLGL
ncbi:MAG: deoxyhypusine synthase family protein [Planctomycetes bacterium]|nr:deoxyhypusine synthase family protein [Planctomycetota bacterium]